MKGVDGQALIYSHSVVLLVLSDKGILTDHLITLSLILDQEKNEFLTVAPIDHHIYSARTWARME